MAAQKVEVEAIAQESPLYANTYCQPTRRSQWWSIIWLHAVLIWADSEEVRWTLFPFGNTRKVWKVWSAHKNFCHGVLCVTRHGRSSRVCFQFIFENHFVLQCLQQRLNTFLSMCVTSHQNWKLLICCSFFFFIGYQYRRYLKALISKVLYELSRT